MSSIWQPRSLSQLVLVSFLVALAPIGWAIFVTVQTLGELADKDRSLTRVVVEATRLGQEIQGDIIELERRALQYIAVGDPELAELFQRERSNLSDKLRSLQSHLPPDIPDIENLLMLLDAAQLPAVSHPASTVHNKGITQFKLQLQEINDQSKAVKNALLISIDHLLSSNAEEADNNIEFLLMQLGLLVAGTLALLLLIAHWINRPVRDLTDEIHQLSTAGLSHPIEISGPAELQSLGSELERLRLSLHESELQKQQFLRHISHELKTPLASLREGADLLADQVPGHLSQQQREIVDIVRQNGIDLQRLIENLIDYNRLPQQDLNVTQFSLADLLKELLENYNLTISNKGQLLRCSNDVPDWTADRYKLKTSLDNLLSNAVHYAPEGGELIVSCSVSNDTLQIDVANSGDPIPVEDRERVFEPFVQSVAKRSGPIKGSGIGLSVARECIEAQGGSLVLAQHPTLPVCFRLLCPAHQL